MTIVYKRLARILK